MRAGDSSCPTVLQSSYTALIILLMVDSNTHLICGASRWPEACREPL